MHFHPKYLIPLIFLLCCTTCGLTDVKVQVPKSKRKLNLSRQGLKEIPSYVFEMKDLEVLRLYENEISELAEELGKLKKLKKLYIGKNKLEYLPSVLGELESLELLSVQYNEIDSISPDLANAKQLTQLIVNNNRLKTLPAFIGDLPELKNLRLNFNELEVIHDSVFNATSLEFISLNRNFLDSIPSTISQCSNLREIHMINAGSLVQLPESLCDLRRMDILEVDKQVVIPQCLLVRQTTPLRIILR